MDSEYPPLPPTRGAGSSARVSSLRASTPSASSEESRESTLKKGRDSQHEERHHLSENPNPAINIISSNGDVIIEYIDRNDLPPVSSASSHRWLVASEDLTQNSPYFRALLDPNKFSEGRDFMKQKTDWSRKTAAGGTKMTGQDTCPHTLPTLSLPVDQSTRKLGVDALELFLRVLSFQSLDDEDKKRNFDAEVKLLAPSLVARLVEIADAFNSPQAVLQALKRSGYVFGKGRISLSKFNQLSLRMSEDRIRQTIYIAHFLGEKPVFQVLTHTLIVLGSRYWVNGIEAPTSDDTFRWLYLTDGLEEELYYRRQCVLNTITDLQAYFLRAYGALEETGPKPTATNHPRTVPATSTTIRPREFQCRCGFGNSNACDAFHLGQMTRFFALRTKTIFLGSSLLDPDFTLDSGEEDEEAGDGYDDDINNNATKQTTTPVGPPADITAIIASLKQFPDYQIDPNHTGCGPRRRIIPSLDCIERFVGDGRGLLGVTLRPGHGDGGHNLPLAASSWTNRSLRRAQSIGIRLSKITAIHYTSPSSARSASQEEDVRLFFTAKKRHWEA